MNVKLNRLIGAVCAFQVFAATGSAIEIVYDNLGTAATAGYSEANSGAPIFGDSLNLSQGGRLSQVGLSLFNSSSGGNVDPILQGTTVVSFYDNSTAYSGGALSLPLLGSASVNWDFTAAGGLGVGFYSTQVFDLSSLGIYLPTEILITQQFTETSGLSTRNGVVLFQDPTVGTSPNTVYLFSASTAEGLYTFSENPGQIGYQIQVVPDSASTLALTGLALAALAALRRHFSLKR